MKRLWSSGIQLTRKSLQQGTELSNILINQQVSPGGNAFSFIAGPDGLPRMVIFQDGIAGSRVDAKIVRRLPGALLADVVRTVEPQPNAQTPKCPHFLQKCGGCTRQQVAYEDQLSEKEAQVTGLLQLHGVTTRVKSIVGSRLTWNYRNHMMFTVGTAKKENDARQLLGKEKSGAMTDNEKGVKKEEREGEEEGEEEGGEEEEVREQQKGKQSRFDRNQRRGGRGRGGERRQREEDDFVASPSELAVGLHMSRCWQHVLPINSCDIQHEQANVILSVLREELPKLGLPPFNPVNHKGVVRQVLIRKSSLKGELQLMVVVVTTSAIGNARDKLQPLVDALVTRVPSVVSIMHATSDSMNDSSSQWSGSEIVLHGTDTIVDDSLQGLLFRVSSTSFMQTNPSQADVLYSLIKETAQLTGNERVIDLFCGTGTIGLACAKQAFRVTGVEQSESAVRDAIANQRLNQIENADFVCADAAKWIENLVEERKRDTSRPLVVIVDPPRPGLHKKIIEALKYLKPDRLVSVSCNPVTHAENLAELSDAMEIQWVQPVDMFPHTTHVESVALLTPKKNSRN